MFKIKLNDLNKIFEVISTDYDLFLPVNKANECNFERYEKDCNFDLKTIKTVKSIKSIFFPQVQNMQEFIVKNKESPLFHLRQMFLTHVWKCDAPFRILISTRRNMKGRPLVSISGILTASFSVVTSISAPFWAALRQKDSISASLYLWWSTKHS